MNRKILHGARVRISISALAIGSLLLLTAGLAQANPPNDFAVGAGKVPSIETEVAFSAHSGPTGEDPSGHFNITIGGNEFDGHVTCLAVSGNRAVLGGEYPDFPGSGIFIRVEDNGNPSGATPDRLTWISGPPATPAFCQFLLTANFFTFPVTQGNIVVNDALVE